MTNKPTPPLLAALFLGLFAGAVHAADKTPGAAEKPNPDAGMALIPAGDFIMGSDKKDTVGLQKKEGTVNPYGFVDPIYVDEAPAHKVSLPAFLIDKYEVTNAQYRDFVIQTRYRVPYTWPRNGYNASDRLLSTYAVEELRRIALDYFKLDMEVEKMSKEAILAELFKIQRTRDNLPVTAVSWSDAFTYCGWAGKRMPTEAEWEKAARGPDSLEYPWGNDWDVKKVNIGSGESEAAAAPVGANPGDKSVYGVYDLAGNVTEWVYDWYDAYPGSTLKHKDYGQVHKVVRGGMASAGHYDTLSYTFRAARRSHVNPETALVDVGFRCAKNAP